MGALTNIDDTTFTTVFETAGGGQIRFHVCHGRVDVTTQSPNGRHRNTTPSSTDRIRFLARRLDELCAVADAERPAKEA